MKRIPKLPNLPHDFRYTFTCDGGTRTHDMICEDWELFESDRRWREKYPTEEERWQKIHDKFYTEFKETDLHFVMGMHSQYPTWMIIGVYRPPKPKM